jgi:hypothetical protein
LTISLPVKARGPEKLFEHPTIILWFVTPTSANDGAPNPRTRPKIEKRMKTDFISTFIIDLLLKRI